MVYQSHKKVNVIKHSGFTNGLAYRGFGDVVMLVLRMLAKPLGLSNDDVVLVGVVQAEPEPGPRGKR
jgi:hypothetical protein